jgi:hypothetical protein
LLNGVLGFDEPAMSATEYAVCDERSPAATPAGTARTIAARSSSENSSSSVLKASWSRSRRRAPTSGNDVLPRAGTQAAAIYNELAVVAHQPYQVRHPRGVRGIPLNYRYRVLTANGETVLTSTQRSS